MDEKELPEISLVIPVYNANSTIALCLESIQKLSYPKNKLEVIVIDNGSSDGSDLIARKFDVRFFYEKSMKSSYQARNTGVKNAKGELIAFTDSDCIVSTDWLLNLIKDWDDNSIGCFAGEIISYKPRSLVEQFSDRYGILRQDGMLCHSYKPYSATANSAYRKEVFDRIGYFNPRLISGGDADLSWRMQKETELKIKFIPDAIVYHKHRTNIIDLYKQYKKYEYGQLLLNRLYRDMPVTSVKERRSELLRSIYVLIRWLPGNLVRYTQNEIDTVTLFSPFFTVISNLGTYMGRLSKLEN